jgi:hypothetical protein
MKIIRNRHGFWVAYTMAKYFGDSRLGTGLTWYAAVLRCLCCYPAGRGSWLYK